MRSIKFLLTIITLSLALSATQAQPTLNNNLERVMNAIIQVESKGNPKAHNRNGDCVGILQITKVCVRECNNILKERDIKKRYTYTDRWDADKSKEMFRLFQSKYNPTGDMEKAARLWNGGINYKRNPRKTNKYWAAVKRKLK